MNGWELHTQSFVLRTALTGLADSQQLEFAKVCSGLGRVTRRWGDVWHGAEPACDDWKALCVEHQTKGAQCRKIGEPRALDGEAIVQDASGVADYHARRRELTRKTSDRLTYYAFDLLFLDGVGLRSSRSPSASGS